MTPDEDTLKHLLGLVENFTINEKTVILYLYYCLHAEESPTWEELQKGTALSLRTLRQHNRVLEAMGAISHPPRVPGHKGNPVAVHPLGCHTTPPPSSSSLSLLLNLASQKSNIEIKRKSEGCGTPFKIVEIQKDADWLKAKESLSLYFKDFELDLNVLLKKNRFSTLMSLLLEEGFDFPGYCRWYHEYKYGEKGFNFGLFLYPAMVEEFREYVEREGKYLKTTTRMVDNDSFKAGVKKTFDFLDSLEDEE